MEFVAEIEREGRRLRRTSAGDRGAEERNQRLSQERDEVLVALKARNIELASMNGNDQAAGKAVECERLVAQLGEDMHELAVLHSGCDRVAWKASKGIERGIRGPVLDRAARCLRR